KLYEINQMDLKDVAQKAKIRWAIEGCFLRGGNSSFIALIPKVTDAKFVADFRPISLIGSVYKVVTKILANRLATVILDLVSNTQSAFVASRQILDGPFILNEVLSWCKRKGKQALVFKVDFAKTYDSVRWNFLLDVLSAFGFGSKWCHWIRSIFSSNMASVLVNGSPTTEFPIYRGLHIRGSTSISHLFYVDDAVFIGSSMVATIRKVESRGLLGRMFFRLRKMEVLVFLASLL
nr:RNA-directed DNA polymerase, eukaryota, reverse transcriptase zinc-binding domain protein [Tanacetum cinerariifolium]